VIELACRLFQANRAVTGLSEFHWPGLKHYYGAARVAEVRELIERMRLLLPPPGRTDNAAPPLFYRPDYRPSPWRLLLWEFVGPVLVYCRPLYNGLRSRWSFSCEELAYMLNRLEAFLQLLQSPSLPGYPYLIAFRNDLAVCHSLIEWRCDGYRELKKVHLVEYFNKSLFLKTIPLSAILTPPARSVA
jgi:hypothetical protein